MQSSFGLAIALSALACSVATEEAGIGSGPSQGDDGLEIVSHGWRLNADGSVTCTFGEEAPGTDAVQTEHGEAVGRTQQRFVVADNYGTDTTLPNNGSRPEGSRCPYVSGGVCLVPGVKSFSWRLSGFNTTPTPDMTNIPFHALGDSLNYHKANTAMQWPFKSSGSRVIFVQETGVSFAQTDTPMRKKHSSSTFGTVWASVPDESPTRVRFNDSALLAAANRLGISDYWSYRVYYEHVFSHEMGHVAGLGHSPNSGDLMYYQTHAGNWSTNWLTNAEIQAIAAFSPGDWSNATVLDLDL
jgi:hypothetical protein